jgi:hypothetical protein
LFALSQFENRALLHLGRLQCDLVIPERKIKKKKTDTLMIPAYIGA